ncbi:hypothetical protein M409DRAFT_21438 [Zasmidium cellare ATCC 36951]|uniref:Alcohol dehydrogenase-like N-terminal domain-containing protein n=1 Tax=Zasmidium cellare ATCC 36951 TaxID=1080233 RepID=A0A6A6CN56_ZASCE|nr:uncharacterized protein M409DRAFT_21438 [Zasmidium cellare ATCC 36951]KAF2168697.1 hypothetical protein M409DRAFT_21438 [Zasmidium cellare ATCC 36951]
MAEIPQYMKALVYDGKTSKVERIPTPQATPGTAVVRVLAAKVNAYAREVYWEEGSDVPNRKYPFPTPLVPGGSAVARVAAVGADSTKLRLGDLVYINNTVRSRDNRSDVFLPGLLQGFTEGSKKLMTEVYRNWTYAQYCLVPLENICVLNENRLTGDRKDGGLGYKIEELSWAGTLAVPYGGLTDINLTAGETIIVAPATGSYGGAATAVALAMGARVIAFGRNFEALEKLKEQVPNSERVEIVPISGDMAADLSALKKFGPIDAYLDIGPPEAAKSTHIKSSILATGQGAKISLMGGYVGDVGIPHQNIMGSNKKLFGKMMYEQSDVERLFKMIEAGTLKIGRAGGSEIVGKHKLEEWRDAWENAANYSTFGQQVVVTP